MNWLTELSTHHKEWVNIARSFGVNDAEDLIQDMYIKLHENETKIIDKVLTDGRVNKPYIYTIIRNRAYTLNSKAKPSFTEVIDIPEPTDVESVQINESIGKIYDSVKEATKDMSHHDSLIFEIRFVHSKSCRDVQRETGYHYLTFFNRMKKIQKRIQDEFGNDYINFKRGNFDKIINK